MMEKCRTSLLLSEWDALYTTIWMLIIVEFAWNQSHSHTMSTVGLVVVKRGTVIGYHLRSALERDVQRPHICLPTFDGRILYSVSFFMMLFCFCVQQGQSRGGQVLVLGLDGAGKSSLLQCFVTGSTEQEVSPTKGFNAVSINREELHIEFLESMHTYWAAQLIIIWLSGC